MPQLNPTPWFPILALSWLIFLTILPSKVMAHAFPNEPAIQSTEKPEMAPWAWPLQ
uniref:ATP synthase complex subunit 8 n=1 Tax=Sladenia gardineri TaxID=412661 RepID=D3KR85_9TELE|nr:ATP synthase F0 subunit 8 [Sladenia gardineri]BAI76972.1 ATPase subunit 8 [Sladenia gardineri]